MHRKRVTSELHDSYFRLMMIKHAIPKIVWAIELAIELLYNSVETGSQWVGDQRSRSQGVVEKATARWRGPRASWRSASWRSDELETRCGRESQQKAEPPGLRLSMRTRTTHDYVRRDWWGQYVAVFVRSPTLSHTQTLQIKWEICFFKEVFPRLYYRVVMILSAWICIRVYIHRHFLPIYFYFDHLKMLYGYYDIQLELVDKFSISHWFPSTLGPLSGHHQWLYQ